MIFSGFRAKFQKIVTCVSFSIKFAKTNQKFAENSEFCENYSLRSLVVAPSRRLLGGVFFFQLETPEDHLELLLRRGFRTWVANKDFGELELRTSKFQI